MNQLEHRVCRRGTSHDGLIPGRRSSLAGSALSTAWRELRTAYGKLKSVRTAKSLIIAAGLLAVTTAPAFGAEVTAQSEELRALIEAYGRIKNAYVDPIDEKKLVSQAIKGMLSGLDPHSAFLDTEALGNWRSDLQGEFGGLGIDLDMEDGLVKIISPIEDTPASRAGLQAGDLITKLDNTEIKGLTLKEAMALMRGKPNTNITLTLLRKGEPTAQVVTLTRALIRIKSVKYKLIEPGYGYVRLTQFQEHSPRAAGLRDRGAVQPEPRAVARPGARHARQPGRARELGRRDRRDLLACRCPGRQSRWPQRRVQPPSARLPRLLSARQQGRLSEALARGRQDRTVDGAGERRVGVGFEKIVRRCTAGSQARHRGRHADFRQGLGAENRRSRSSTTQRSSSPTARYFTPSGRSIQAKGITPDVSVEEAPVGTPKPAARVREADLDRHLSNPSDNATAQESGKPTLAADKKGSADNKDEKKPGEKVDKQPKPDYGSKDDYQLNRARPWRRWRPAWRRWTRSAGGTARTGSSSPRTGGRW